MATDGRVYAEFLGIGAAYCNRLYFDSPDDGGNKKIFHIHTPVKRRQIDLGEYSRGIKLV